MECSGANLLGVLCVIRLILEKVVALLVSFAVIFFIYGIIGLFVMVSMWGIVYLLVNSFNLDLKREVEVPYFPEGSDS